MTEPHVVRMSLVENRSLIDTGTPWSGGSGLPLRPSACVARRAAVIADSRATVTYAFTTGFTASRRARTACITSSGETFRALYKRASSVAERKQRSRLWLKGWVGTGLEHVQTAASTAGGRRNIGRRLYTSQRVTHSTGPTAK